MKFRPLLAALALFLTAALPLQAQEKKITRVGDFQIIAIFEKGRFDRCAAVLTNGTGMLRLAYTTKRIYSLSVPGVKGHGPDEMALRFDGGASQFYFATGANDDRAWLTLDQSAVDAFRDSSEQFDVDFAGRAYSWSLYNAAMTDVFLAIEDCTGARM